MHEMSLVASLQDIVTNAAHRSPFLRVERLYLVIGNLSCVDAETLRWCIRSSAEGTLLEGADIVVEHEQALAHCQQCHLDYVPDTLITPCPQCGQPAQSIDGGRDMRIRAIDVVPLSTTSESEGGQ